MVAVVGLTLTGMPLEVAVAVEHMGAFDHHCFTIRNAGAGAVDGWTIDITLPGAVAGVHGAVATTLGTTRYRIAPDAWRRVLAPGEAASVGLLVASGPLQRTAA